MGVVTHHQKAPHGKCISIWWLCKGWKCLHAPSYVHRPLTLCRCSQLGASNLEAGTQAHFFSFGLDELRPVIGMIRVPWSDV